MGDVEMVIFSVYLPWDATHDADNTDAYNSLLIGIKNIAESTVIDMVITAGDMNTDLSRSYSSHTKLLNSFAEREHFVMYIRQPASLQCTTYI